MPSPKRVQWEKMDDSSSISLVLLVACFQCPPQEILGIKMRGLGPRDAHAFFQLERHAIGRSVPPELGCPRGPDRDTEAEGIAGFRLMFECTALTPPHAPWPPSSGRPSGGAFPSGCEFLGSNSGRGWNRVIFGLHQLHNPNHRRGAACDVISEFPSGPAAPGAHGGWCPLSPWRASWSVVSCQLRSVTPNSPCRQTPMPFPRSHGSGESVATAPTEAQPGLCVFTK